MELVNGKVYKGFLVVEDGVLERLGVRYWRLKHLASGATLVYTDRDDGQLVFSASFRTLPEDDTGVFHILEHSCLDGSENFRLKEPFVNILCSSLAVDLNAGTYPDKTVYYYITTNEKDYMNIMSVYLDSVFHPLLLSDRRIFEKEAWHLEPDGQGGVVYNGIVFNEMQGRENMADTILWHGIQAELYPDNCYSRDGGGRPTAIPDLTYEQFCETYKRFYSAENCVIYMSGKLGLAEELDYIDKVLLGVPKYGYECPLPMAPHRPTVNPDARVRYQLAQGEDEKLNTRLALAYVLGDGNDSAATFSFAMLSLYLAQNPTSPLSKAVLDAGIGQDFSMIIENYYRQPAVCFTLAKSKEEYAERFREVILSELKKYVKEGLDLSKLKNLLDKHEVDCRRKALDVDTGFQLMESIVRSLTQLGYIRNTDDLDTVRKKLASDPKYFEHLIEKYILDSKHWTLVRCVPSTTVADEKKEIMTARLKAEADKLSATDGAYEALTRHVEEFKEYLGATDSPEEIAKVPHLSLSDIGRENRLRDVDVREATLGNGKSSAVKSLFYEGETHGMTLAGLLFDLKKIPTEDLFYASCLAQSLFMLPTEQHSAEELTDLWIKLKAMTNANAATTNPSVAGGDCEVYLDLGFDVPVESLSAASKLLEEYMTSVVFDREILARLFSNSANIKDGMIWSGNSTAVAYASRTVCKTDAYKDLISGVSAYRRFKSLEDSIGGGSDADGESMDKLIDGMKRVASVIFGSVEPIAYLVGDEKAYGEWSTALSQMNIAASDAGESYSITMTPKADRALAINGDVNYCAEVFDACGAGIPVTNRLLPVCKYIYGTFMWDEVRAKGGAYGGGINVSPWGLVKLYSYRDPRVKETYDVYAELPDWLEKNIPEREEIEKNIVSTASSSCFAPESILSSGKAAVVQYLRGLDAKTTWARLTEIFNTTEKDFYELAEIIRRMKASGHGIRSTLGNREQIEASGLFEDISDL